MGASSSIVNQILGPLSVFDAVVNRTLNPLDNAVSNIQRLGVFDNAEDAQRQQVRAQNDLALQQLKQQQRLGEDQSAQDAALERERRAEQSRQANEQRQAALRRAVARQRARFGASGVGSVNGSSEAVLLGMFDESDEERENRERLDRLRNRALEQDQSQLRSRNVLAATQAAQRNQLKRLSTNRDDTFLGLIY